ncbi:Protein FAR-RED IMPAIRED RESPONSE [Arachis hypogaea]|nr:Protein FAR-RED IMPAIRED RESPONSE [Arachis hypogaea]
MLEIDEKIVFQHHHHRFVPEKDLLAEAKSLDVPASDLEEKEFRLSKKISTFPYSSCFISRKRSACLGWVGMALSIDHDSGRSISSHLMSLETVTLAFVTSGILEVIVFNISKTHEDGSIQAFSDERFDGNLDTHYVKISVVTGMFSDRLDIKLILGDFGYLLIVNGLIDIFEANFFFKDIVFGRKFVRSIHFLSKEIGGGMDWRGGGGRQRRKRKASRKRTEEFRHVFIKSDIIVLLCHQEFLRSDLITFKDIIKLALLPKCQDSDGEAIANVIVSGFSGKLKGWWDNYLSDSQKQSIFSAIKLNDQNEPIIGDDGEPIPDAVNTLIFTIASHFIGDPSLWKDHSAELLSNLRCKTLSDFRWYKDTFLIRVYTREDSQQPFWKEKLLAGLPKSLGDKVWDKIRSLTPDGIIPYDELSYGQLISFIQKVALKICQDDKIQRQLAHEKTQNRIDLGTFCEQFGLPVCHPRKSKRPSNKKIFKPNPEKNFRRNSKGHVSKYCRLKRKINNLNLDPQIEDQINNLLIESSDDDSGRESSDDINNIQVDDIELSSDSNVK